MQHETTASSTTPIQRYGSPNQLPADLAVSHGWLKSTSPSDRRCALGTSSMDPGIGLTVTSMMQVTQDGGCRDAIMSQAA